MRRRIEKVIRYHGNMRRWIEKVIRYHENMRRWIEKLVTIGARTAKRRRGRKKRVGRKGERVGGIFLDAKNHTTTSFFSPFCLASRSKACFEKGGSKAKYDATHKSHMHTHTASPPFYSPSHPPP